MGTVQSRAGLITGKHQQRFGFEGNDDAGKWDDKKQAIFGVDLSQKTMADQLKTLGYYTGIVGKWHLGYEDKFYPNKRGFDYFYGLRGGSRTFFPDPKLETSTSPLEHSKLLEKNGVILPESQITHVTETLGDAAIEFIDAARKHNQPFFLYLSFTAPHSPLQSDPESLEQVVKLFPDALKKRQNYLGLVRGMDRHAGRVLDHLKQCGLDKNTLVVFLSDNGGSAKNASNNDPLHGYKWTPFEGGYRVPMAIKWPGVVAPGTVLNTPVVSLDLMPTFITAAGGSVPDGLDGIDLTPLLAGKEKSLKPRLLLWRDTNGEGWTKTILRDPWKLILRQDSKFKKLKTTEPWLFNIGTDLQETDNLAEQYPETVKELSGLVNDWSSTLEDPRW
ncbi:MAG: sulfatase-like hydrolase/transferase [Kiritimatiellales bacterium]|nr:sulfatase-like hydrolase/transferase [Kiritimatiellales bacterium]